VDEFIEKLETRFGKITHENGDVISFLGLRIAQDPTTGEVTINQPSYIVDLTMDIPDINLPSCPATKDLLKRSDFGEPVDRQDFLSRVMKLMFAATKTRPDILFPVSTLASNSSDPRESDLNSLNRIYLYLRGTRDFKMHLKCKTMDLSASVDASHAIHRDNKGHTGMVLFISGCPIFSRSIKQKSVATSSTHAEILALYESVPYIVWIRELLTELGYPQNQPTMVEQDNMSALTVYEQGWSKSNKTRHISVKYAYITEQIDDGVIKPTYVPTGQMKADILTKPITGSRFKEYYNKTTRPSI
jgi:hypothetical protein